MRQADGFDRVMGWMDRNAGKVIAIYVIGSLATAVAVGSVILHFVRKLW